jgi:integrase
MARRGDGIYLRGKTWWLDFVHDGRRHVARLGKGISRTVAGELAQVKRAAILKGEAGIGLAPTTVRAYSEKWLKRGTDLAPSTLACYRKMLDLYILPRFGSEKLAALDRGKIRALLADKRAGGRTRLVADDAKGEAPQQPAGLSKNTVRLIRATLSVMLADALDAGLVKVNVAQGLSRRGRKGPESITQAERQKKIRPMSTEQLRAFLEAAQGRQGEGVLFLTLADAGLRPSEALALQWPDLDGEDRTLWIERNLEAGGTVRPTKTGTSRAVDLTPRLADALDRWQAELEKEAIAAGRDPAPWIFPAEDGGPLDLDAVTRRFRRLLKKAELPRFRLYDLRHTYATHSLAAGAPITYVAAQLGHAKPTTTLAFYAHWLPTADRTWAERLERARVAIHNGNHNTATADVGHDTQTV